MKAVSLLPSDSEGHVEMALPWYVNGTLSGAERAEVESHLSECARCRASHHLEGLLKQPFNAADETVEPGAEAGWTALSQKLNSSPATAPRFPAAAARERHRRSPRSRARWRPLISLLLFAQAGAIAALALALTYVLQERSAAPYRTLTDAQDRIAAAAPALRVVFADEATSARIRELLAQIGGTISAGPGTSHVYTVQLLGEGGLHTHTPVEAAKWLRVQDGVLFAEPVDFSASR